MNVSGHRISTTEVESALVDHPAVAEAAVVGATDPTSGQAIVAFVTLRVDAGEPNDERGQELRAHVADEDRTDRPAEDGRVHRRAPEDPQREDHAPAPARRGRGPGARRHHHAGRPRGGRRDPPAGRDGADRRVSPVGRPRPTGPGTARPSSRRARRWCSTWTACCRTRSAASTSSSVGAATGTPSSMRAATTRSSARWSGSSSSSTPACRSSCSPAGPCGCSPRRWPGWSGTGCGGTCWSCGPAGDYSQVTWFKRDSVEELRAFGFDLRLAFEDDPNNFAMFHAEGIPCVYIHSGYYD